VNSFGKSTGISEYFIMTTAGDEQKDSSGGGCLLTPFVNWGEKLMPSSTCYHLLFFFLPPRVYAVGAEGHPIPNNGLPPGISTLFSFNLFPSN
jgi:hypothetical protein